MISAGAASEINREGRITGPTSAEEQSPRLPCGKRGLFYCFYTLKRMSA